MRSSVFREVKIKKFTKKRLFVFVVILLLLISTSGIYVIWKNRTIDITKPACLDSEANSILGRSIDSLNRPDDKQSRERLSSLKDEILKKKDYQKDINCIYILAINSLNYESLAEAEKLINQYESLVKSNPNSKQPYFDDVETLRKKLSDKKKVVESIKNNVYLIKDFPPQK